MYINVQVAFLAAMVGPKVAAAAAQRALEVLSEDDPSIGETTQSIAIGDNYHQIPGSADSSKGTGFHYTRMARKLNRCQFVSLRNCESYIVCGNIIPLAECNKLYEVILRLEESIFGVLCPYNCSFLGVSSSKMRVAAATALSAAAVKAKLMAEQEEREIQRLVVTVVDSQLKKLEAKLKYSEELDKVCQLQFLLIS